MSTRESGKVTSSEFIKNFGELREVALSRPVIITNHGRDSLVIMSAAEYERLKSFDTRRHYLPHELPEHLKEAIIEEVRKMEASDN